MMALALASGGLGDTIDEEDNGDLEQQQERMPTTADSCIDAGASACRHR